MKKGREIVLATAFTEPKTRAWAAQSTQIDVVDYEIVVIHGSHARPPAIAAEKREAAGATTDNIVRTGIIDGRRAFELTDGTWVLAAMGYDDRVRSLLLRSGPPRAAVPTDVNQLVSIRRAPWSPRKPCRMTSKDIFCSGPLGPFGPAPGLESVVLATKADGSYVMHAHYTDAESAQGASRPALPVTVESCRHGADVYARGY